MKSMKKSESIFIFKSFLIWRISLFIILYFAIKFLTLQSNYLGGGLQNYLQNPYLWSWGNFDGEHYLSLSLYGYKSLEQAFFPIFPMLISFIAYPFSQTVLSGIISHTIVGLLISNVSFLITLFYLSELIKIDFSKKIAILTILFIVCFPTSFFFGSLYNESLFLLLVVLTFLNGRKGKWFQACFFGIVASATRVFGVLLLPVLLIEAYQSKAKFSQYFWILFIPLGLIFYMMYQYITVGDALAFYHLQTIIGSQHQGGFISLPQVYFRYIKILLSLDRLNPLYQTIVLEFIIGIIFLILPLVGYFKKIRLSYIFYSLVGFLIPTIQGSFSSTTRYVIVLFPSFIILALITDKSKIIKYILLTMFTLLLIIETVLFLRGYWVA